MFSGSKQEQRRHPDRDVPRLQVDREGWTRQYRGHYAAVAAHFREPPDDVHQLSAFDAEALKRDLRLLDALEPIAMMGIGKGAITEATPQDLVEMEEGRKVRERKPLSDLVKSLSEPFSA